MKVSVTLHAKIKSTNAELQDKFAQTFEFLITTNISHTRAIIYMYVPTESLTH